MNSLFLRNQLFLWWCGRGVFVKLILALIRIQLFWSSFMNTECWYIRPPSHSSNSWSRSWLDEGVEECEPRRETGWKRCNPAPSCRHKLPKFDKISFTQSIQLTLVHSPQRQILDPLESQLSAWAGRRAGLQTSERRGSRDGAVS